MILLLHRRPVMITMTADRQKQHSLVHSCPVRKRVVPAGEMAC